MTLILQIVVALVIFRWVTTRPRRRWWQRPRPITGEATLTVTIEGPARPAPGP